MSKIDVIVKVTLKVTFQDNQVKIELDTTNPPLDKMSEKQKALASILAGLIKIGMKEMELGEVTH